MAPPAAETVNFCSFERDEPGVSSEKASRPSDKMGGYPPQKPPSKRPNAQTVILLGIGIDLALFLALILAQRYL
jgi:hypothetical protein